MKHSFKETEYFFTGQKTFSVSIFQWIPKSSAKGLKKGPKKVRVIGPVSDPDLVYEIAREIVKDLDHDRYDGPKTVRLIHLVGGKKKTSRVAG